MNTPPQTTSFAHQAAKLSWACPIIVFLLLMFGRQVSSPVILDLIALLLIVVGLIFGVIALFGISKHGRKGILAPAIVGIIINGLLLFIFVTNFIAARARAQQHTSIETSPVVAVWSNKSPEPTAVGAVSSAVVVRRWLSFFR
jgi:uncharacterized membrane protein YeaQ/YmgE (transglycosylase-associated protein family)